MNYFEKLNDEEIKFLCLKTIKDWRKFFSRNTRLYNDLKPGSFRIDKLPDDDIASIVVKNKNDKRIQKFFKNNIDKEFSKIHNEFINIDNDDPLMALIDVLPRSILTEKYMYLYFRLPDNPENKELEEEFFLNYRVVKCIDKYYSKDKVTELKGEITNLQGIVNEKLKNADRFGRNIEQLQKEIDELKNKILMNNDIDNRVDDVQYSVNELKKYNHDLFDMLNVLGSKSSVYFENIDKLEKDILRLKNEKLSYEDIISRIEEFKKTLKEHDQYIYELIENLENTNKELKEIKIPLDDNIYVKNKEIINKKQLFADEVINKPLKPKDKEEFIEYLWYNIVSICGYNYDENKKVFSNAFRDDYSKIKKYFDDYIYTYFFGGTPIVMHSLVSHNLLKCLSNTIYGGDCITYINFKSNLTEADINEFFIKSDRIICLDNFLGNYDELSLLPFIKKYRNRIIVFTYYYEGTLKYISEEFFQYAHYFNIDGIIDFSEESVFYEDSSRLDEEEYVVLELYLHYSKQLYIILQELNFPRNVIDKKCREIFSEDNYYSLLFFEILPYCRNVKGVIPFKQSDKLAKDKEAFEKNISKKFVELFND